MESPLIRKGERRDLPATLELIRELAIYEKEPDAVETTVDSMTVDGFGSDKIFGFFVAEIAGEIVGIALFYEKYSTWKGRCLYLEDLVVKESFRRHGIGAKLFERVMDEARQRGSKRMEWQVLDWNEPAICFYKNYGAKLDGEWINGVLTEKGLQRESL